MFEKFLQSVSDYGAFWTTQRSYSHSMMCPSLYRESDQEESKLKNEGWQILVCSIFNQRRNHD